MRRRLQALALGAIASLAGGCSLLLDFGGSLVDAGPGDGGTGDGGLVADEFEPNNDFSRAAELVPGTYPSLSILPATDRDFYKFTVTGGPRDVVIEARFVTLDGDLDLELYDDGSPPVRIGYSAGLTDNERIERTSAGGGQLGDGTYYIHVFAAGAQYTNGYTLVLTVM